MAETQAKTVWRDVGVGILTALCLGAFAALVSAMYGPRPAVAFATWDCVSAHTADGYCTHKRAGETSPNGDSKESPRGFVTLEVSSRGKGPILEVHITCVRKTGGANSIFKNDIRTQTQCGIDESKIGSEPKFPFIEDFSIRLSNSAGLERDFKVSYDCSTASRTESGSEGGFCLGRENGTEIDKSRAGRGEPLTKVKVKIERRGFFERLANAI